jgi:hypothetical protein
MAEHCTLTYTQLAAVYPIATVIMCASSSFIDPAFVSLACEVLEKKRYENSSNFLESYLEMTLCTINDFITNPRKSDENSINEMQKTIDSITAPLNNYLEKTKQHKELLCNYNTDTRKEEIKIAMIVKSLYEMNEARKECKDGAELFETKLGSLHFYTLKAALSAKLIAKSASLTTSEISKLINKEEEEIDLCAKNHEYLKEKASTMPLPYYSDEVTIELVANSNHTNNNQTELFISA